jgi:hypothetical protein
LQGRHIGKTTAQEQHGSMPAGKSLRHFGNMAGSPLRPWKNLESDVYGPRLPELLQKGRRVRAVSHG